MLLAGFGWAVSIWLPGILTVGGEKAQLLQQCFQLAVLAMALGILNECLRSFSQALLRPVIPDISIMLGRISGIGISLWMLFNDFGLLAIPTGLLFAESLIFILNFLNTWSVFRKLKVRVCIDKTIIKDYLRASPVLLMATAGNRISQESDPLLITMGLGPEVTTAYMLTRRAADVVFHLLNVLIGSTMGSFAHLVASADHEKTKSVVKKMLTLSFSLGAIGFAVYVGTNQAFVSLWVGESFVLSQEVILFIALGFFARTFRGLIGQMLYGLGDFTYTSAVILLEGVIRIVLAIGLLKLLGEVGVPLAFTISCLLTIVILGYRLRKKLKMGFHAFALVRLLLSCTVLIGISFHLVQLSVVVDSWLDFILYLVGFLVGTLAIYVLMNWVRCRELYKSVRCMSNT